ncbi:beta-lactamase/transpeptidase-like protein [Lophiotrema nucula]|uniref:Beta-lactamase/transpeptidase-like protein n=1 Tax=Lophiotrema nucula TaxID=690887 RepID=A0A6A5YVD0_9PLEO|nr:beta-lactamase/transpeptidase-like protein [Lophiotrema nucula]
MSLFKFFVFLTFTAVISASSYAGCPPDGPLLPRPKDLANSAFVQNATQQLQTSIDQALTGQIRAGWSVENTSFSIGLMSADDPSNRPIWEYHYRGSGNANGTETIDGDTQYLIGSISKLVSDLLVLRTGIDLDASITEYLPQLSNSSSIVHWENVTLASLADHLSGIPPNYGFSEFCFLTPLLEELGFPPISPDDLADCGITGLNGPCSQQQLLDGMITAQPITVPYQRPVYSQLSFTLLSYALSAKFNKTYAELLDEYVVKPLGLDNTGVSPGNTSLAAIPPVENSWGSDYGDNAPGGGLVSSLNDISRIMKFILDYTALNTETEVREWLKPHSSTSSPYTLVGRPWEIFRSTNLTPAHPHTIDIYSKNGGAYGYTAQMAAIDQYGIGIAILTSGPADAYRILNDAMLSVFLPAVEEEARLQAQQYTGSFASDDNLQFYSYALPQFGVLSPEFRIFPAEFTQDGVLEQNGQKVTVIREDWRINLDFLPNTAESSGSELPGQGAWKEFCSAWQTTDWFYYGGKAVDRIVFLKEREGGNILGVEVPFLRVTLINEAQ